jgi:lipoprotein-anchoring transpeptidase ErfK/SrfK
MRLFLMRPRNLTFLAAAALVAVLYASPASPEPSAGAATTPDLDLSEPSALAGPQEQEDALSSQPEPVYPDGEPDIETVESDDADEDAAPSAPIVVANIDKSRQEMTVFVDGVETYTWPVSTGIGGYSTPSGEFTTSSMNKIWYSRQWDNAPMPHAVFFTKKGHAIHATNETKKLGKPASHGCVRLSPKNAETFFNLVKETGLENTQVVLTGETPGGEYKITQPQRDNRRRDPYGYYDRYGYYEEQQPVQRQRRRLFQPYYQAPPPQQYQQQPRRKRWFFRN